MSYNDPRLPGTTFVWPCSVCPNDFWKKQNFANKQLASGGLLSAHQSLSQNLCDCIRPYCEYWPNLCGRPWHWKQEKKESCNRRLPFSIDLYIQMKVDLQMDHWMSMMWNSRPLLWYGSHDFPLGMTLYFLFGTGAVSCTDYEDPYPPDPTTVTSFDVNVAGEYVFYYTCKAGKFPLQVTW